MPKVIDCEYVGKHETYDIEVDHEDHQYYLANGLLTSNSAHAKSYALISMQTAFVRTYYPMEYFAALLTKGQASELQSVVDDMKQQGFKVLPVDINMSKLEHTIEGDAIRLSLTSVKGVGEKQAQKIVDAQPFDNFRDYLYKTNGNKGVTKVLIMAGAFLDFNDNIKLLEERFSVWSENNRMRTKRNRDFFEEKYFEITDAKDYSPEEMVAIENDLLGFNVRGNPFTILDRDVKIKESLDFGQSLSYEQFLESKQLSAVVPVIIKDIRKRTQKNGKPMAFIKFSDIENNEFECPCFASLWKHLSGVIKKGKVYFATFWRKKDELNSLIVGELTPEGKGKWFYSENEALACMINIDKCD